MSSYIHFIRHGITEGIVNKWYYGSSDLPLIDEGYEALKQFKAEGIYPPLGDADCYTSGMLRADQTLQTIYGDVPFTAIPLLREMNFGNWECKTFEELQSEPEYEEWMNNTEGSFHYPGGGDSVLTFYERIQDGLKAGLVRNAYRARREAFMEVGVVGRIVLQMLEQDPV